VKPEIFKASAEKGTNKLYTLCHKKISTQNGAFIKIGENNIFYRIESCEDLNIKRKFTVEDGKIILKGNFEFKISAQDLLKIYITEYEATSIYNIKPHEQHFVVGERIYAQGGVTSSSEENLTGEYASFEVAEVNGKSNITQLSMVNPGRYLSPPKSPVKLMNQDEKIIEADIDFDTSTQILAIEREVQIIDGNERQSEIKVAYGLPASVEEGELLISKQVVYIDRPYSLDSFESELCQITFDYSPVNGIPLLPPNSIDPATTYNKGVEIIDSRLADIEKRLARLEKVNF
jgi:hypothetical protein